METRHLRYSLSLSFSRFQALVSLFATPVRSPPLFPASARVHSSFSVTQFEICRCLDKVTDEEVYCSSNGGNGKGPLRNSGEISGGIFRIDVIVSHRLLLKVGNRQMFGRVSTLVTMYPVAY